MFLVKVAIIILCLIAATHSQVYMEWVLIDLVVAGIIIYCTRNNKPHLKMSPSSIISLMLILNPLFFWAVYHEWKCSRRKKAKKAMMTPQ